MRDLEIFTVKEIIMEGDKLRNGVYPQAPKELKTEPGYRGSVSCPKL